MRSKSVFLIFVSVALVCLPLMGCQSLGFDRYSKYMMGKIPEQYVAQTNPLPLNEENILEGERLYREYCVLCHGVTGRGDGELSTQLSPRPANLILTRTLPIASDAFFIWTISEGGGPFDSDMPSFRGSLSKNQIWQITRYVKRGI